MTMPQTASADHAAHQGHEGHGGHGNHGDHVAQFRRLFWIMVVLAIPTVAFSSMFAMILGYTVPEFPGVRWVSPVLGTVMYFWGGQPFLTGAISEIRSRAPGMMLLIGLAITVAFISSWGASLGVLDHQLDFWWELALLIVIMLLGHWIEMRSLAQTSSALDSLAALLPDEAERVEGDGIVTVAPSDLRVGDVVVVRPGGSVPADGEIIDGAADMNESMVTGESRPVRRGVGDHLVAGTVATDSGLRVTVTAVGDDTALAGIQRLVTEAQNSSSRAQRLADKAAGWLFWFALGAAVITAVVWGVTGRPEEAVIRTITVLVIACPHALGLAIPLVVSIATERAARGGVLVKDRLALESMRTVGAVLFDKTGTLTKGEPSVTAIAATGRRSEDDVLALAAAAEADSEHPLARAIVEAARLRNRSRPHRSISPRISARKAPLEPRPESIEGVVAHHIKTAVAVVGQRECLDRHTELLQRSGRPSERPVDYGGDQIADEKPKRAWEAADDEALQVRKLPQPSVPERLVVEAVVQIEQERRSRLQRGNARAQPVFGIRRVMQHAQAVTEIHGTSREGQFRYRSLMEHAVGLGRQQASCDLEGLRAGVHAVERPDTLGDQQCPPAGPAPGVNSSTTGLPSTPGGSWPRRISARQIARASQPSRWASSIRWPTPHSSRPSSATGRASSISVDQSPSVRPSRWRRKARTGCCTKRSRSSSSTTGELVGGNGVARNGGAAGRSCVRWRAPSRVTRSKLQGSSPASAPGVKFSGSNGWSGWCTTIASRGRVPPLARTVRSTMSSSSPTGTAGGRLAFVRSSRPV